MMGNINPELSEKEELAREKDEQLKEIIHDIIVAKAELATATQNYNFADSDELIDIFSYKIIAAQTKYNMLLKKAKQNGIAYADYLNDTVKLVKNKA